MFSCIILEQELLKVFFECMFSCIILEQELLKVDQRVFMSVWVVLLETNLELKLRTVFLRECKLASFHNSIFLFSGRFIGADGAISTRTMSWSLMPGITLHFRTRLGRFVMKMSRVLLLLVGNLITCSRPVSYRVSSMNLLIESGYWVEVTVLLFQLMSGRFMAPAIQMV